MPQAPKFSLLDLAKKCDDFPPPSSAPSPYYTLYLPSDPTPHGYLHPSTVADMPWTDAFSLSHTGPPTVTILAPPPSSSITSILSSLVTTCIDAKLFHVLAGTHSELVPILGARGSDDGAPVLVERFAAALFGIVTRGAHLLAYTTQPVGSNSTISYSPISRSNDTAQHSTSSDSYDRSSSSSSGGSSRRIVTNVWVSRRALHLYTGAGKLDSTVAGGIKAGMTPRETVVEEAWEEASLPREWVRENACARGVVTTMRVTGEEFPGERGLVMPNVDYVYDVELAEGMVPRPLDGEVEKFTNMRVEEIVTALREGEFKTEPAVVMVDFLIRHGVVTEENESDYVEIIGHLHRQLPFRVRSG